MFTTPQAQEEMYNVIIPYIIFYDMADEPDIAFNYPIDGCYARAELMVDRIQKKYDDITPNKAWAFGDLNVKTDTSYGDVSWRYHVAPEIDTKSPAGNRKEWVIDPSIANGPVSPEGWMQIMNTNTSVSNLQITGLGQSPTNPLTGGPFPGSGYWPGQNPTNFGGVIGYSTQVMKLYMYYGREGITGPLPPPY